MRRMMRGLRVLRRDERGASAVVIGISLTMLMGFVGFAVDGGSFYQERRELQTGADAGALAIAEDCGFGLACDYGSASATAAAYANANASDGLAGIQSLDLNLAESKVTVTTETLTTGGSNIFPPFFMQVLGFNGSTVWARATAVWGYPRGLTTLPLIISDCEWDKFGGTLYVDPPPSGFDPGPTTILFHDGNSTEDCNAEAGQDADGDGKLPGGFGWLDTDGGCEATIQEDDWISGDPGSSPSTGCSASVFESIALGQTVLIPYFDDVLACSGSEPQCTELGLESGKKWYHVAGFGALYVTGYNFAGLYKETMTGSLPCSGDERCIAGYFTTASATEGELGGEFRGVVIVKLTE